LGSKNYHTLEGVLRKRGRSTRTIPRTSFVVMACILSVVSALRAQDQQTSVAVLARKSVDGTVVSGVGHWRIIATQPRCCAPCSICHFAIALRRSLVQM